jgi:hypothetical protein
MGVMMQTTRYSLPPLEWKGHSYKWKLPRHQCERLGLSDVVDHILFSQARDGSWWFKVIRHGPVIRMYGRAMPTTRPTSWMPVPGLDFQLPQAARLLKETARLPAMTPREWGEMRGYA